LKVLPPASGYSAGSTVPFCSEIEFALATNATYSPAVISAFCGEHAATSQSVDPAATERNATERVATERIVGMPFLGIGPVRREA
jgi:hypothetical protein